MPRRAQRAPGDLQLEILEVLWRSRELSASEVHAELARHRQIALTTVATVLRRMDAAGVITHRAVGRQHVYRAAVTRLQMRRSSVAALVRRWFGGDRSALVSHLVEAEDLSAEDRERIRALLGQHRPKGRGQAP
jgi:predicted transcriptional regulator